MKDCCSILTGPIVLPIVLIWALKPGFQCPDCLRVKSTQQRGLRPRVKLKFIFVKSILGGATCSESVVRWAKGFHQRGTYNRQWLSCGSLLWRSPQTSVWAVRHAAGLWTQPVNRLSRWPVLHWRHSSCTLTDSSTDNDCWLFNSDRCTLYIRRPIQEAKLDPCALFFTVLVRIIFLFLRFLMTMISWSCFPDLTSKKCLWPFLFLWCPFLHVHIPCPCSLVLSWFQKKLLRHYTFCYYTMICVLSLSHTHTASVDMSHQLYQIFFYLTWIFFWDTDWHLCLYSSIVSVDVWMCC